MVPFALKNAPSFFQRMTNRVLARIPLAGCYIDDTVGWSKSYSKHLHHLEIVFNKLKDVGLKVHPSKCSFGATIIEHKGHRVTTFGQQPQTKKIATITAMAAPKDVSSLRPLWFVFLLSQVRTSFRFYCSSTRQNFQNAL